MAFRLNWQRRSTVILAGVTLVIGFILITLAVREAEREKLARERDLAREQQRYATLFTEEIDSLFSEVEKEMASALYVVCHLPLEDNLEVNIRGKKSHFTDTVGHINFYNKKSALQLFKDCGFNVRKMVYTCSDVSADYKLKSLPRRLIAQPLRKVFFRCFPRFTASVLGNCSLMVLLEPDSKM